MRKRSRVLLCLLLILLVQLDIPVFAQPSVQADSVFVFKLLNRAGEIRLRSNFDSAISLTQHAIQYSRLHKYPAGEAWSIIKWNDLLIETDELEQADRNAATIYRLGRQLKDSIVIAISYLHKAQVRLYRDDWDSATYFFEKALSGKLENLRIEYTALAYNDLGYTWGKKEDLEKMTDYCLRSLSIYEALGDPVGCAMTLGNISTVYYSLGQMPKAIDYAKRSLQYREKAGDINKLALACCNLSQMLLGVDTADAARYMYRCQRYAIQSGDEARIIHSYITSSVVSNGRQQQSEALGYEMKAIDMLEKSGADNRALARRYIAAAFYANALKKDTSLAIAYFNKSIKISDTLGNKTNLRDAYKYLSDFYHVNKNYLQAFNNYVKFVSYRDSINSADRETNIAELEAKYETAKKDNEISRLNADQRIRQLEIEKQAAIISGNKLEAAQKATEIDLLVQQKTLQDLQLQQQQEELAKQKLIARNNEQILQLARQEKLLNENQLSNQRQLRNGLLAGALLLLIVAAVAFSRYQLKRKLAQQTAMQQMRNNIASDLHDDIGASLSNISILNELTRRYSGDPARVNEYLGKASEDIKQVSEGISDIVWNINPRYDDLENLFIRMKRYASDILDAKNIHYRILFPNKAGNWALDMNKRRDFYLLFKEVINNLAKYSKATDASIELTLTDSNVRLSVEDNGVGFDPASVNSGNGLHNMQQRAASLNGTLIINSKPGAGTQVLLNLPASI